MTDFGLPAGTPTFPCRWRLRADWDRNGNFTGTHDDITADCTFIETFRGCDRGSQIVCEWSAGELRAGLRRYDGKYSNNNASSPLTGLITPGVEIELSVDAAGSDLIVWKGHLESLRPVGRRGTITEYELIALGPIAKLTQRQARYPAQTSQNTGEIIEVLLSPPGDATPPALTYVDTGQTEIPEWGIPKMPVLAGIRDLERTEMGRLAESNAGQYVFEDRYHRLQGTHLTSQATWADTGAGGTLAWVEDGIEELDTHEDMADAVSVPVQFFTVDSEAVLWTYRGGNVSIGPGQSVTLLAEYPNAEVGSTDGAWVKTWTLPVIGEDILFSGVAAADLSIVLPDFGMGQQRTATTQTIEVLNSHATATATLTLVQARGLAVRRLAVTNVVREDGTPDEPQTYDAVGPWIPTVTLAEAYASYLLSQFVDPVPWRRITFDGRGSAALQAECLTRQPSDRVTVIATGQSKLGFNEAHFVEGVGFSIRKNEWRATFLVSQADVSTYWILGDATFGVLGTTTRPVSY